MNPDPAMFPGGWTLADPLWLLALLLLPLAAWWRSRRPRPVLVIPRVAKWASAPAVSMGRMPSLLAALGFLALVVALARPQQLEEKKQVRQKGYDIMLAIDLSLSMLAEDYQDKFGGRVNRLEAIRPIIEAFILNRPTDRIGVVIYSGRAFTLSPLTFDHAWLARQMQRLRIGAVREQGTAVGDGLGLALSRLSQAQRIEQGNRKGAFVILMTDGKNNSGVLDPLEAASLAKDKGIPVYTIAAGRDPYAPIPEVDPNTGRYVLDDFGRKRYGNLDGSFDEETLKKISSVTDGKFFRAMDVGTAEDAFAAIDKRQRIEFDAKAQIRSHEWFVAFAAPGLAGFFAGLALARPGRWGRAT